MQSVKRNPERFPGDFMFRLSPAEAESLRSQIVISKGRGGSRYAPYAFTEQGVAMLSGVLNSPRAIAVNVEIMRAFVRLRRMTASHAHLARRLDELEKWYDVQFKAVFDAIRELMAPPRRTARRLAEAALSGPGDSFRGGDPLRPPLGAAGALSEPRPGV